MDWCAERGAACGDDDAGTKSYALRPQIVLSRSSTGRVRLYRGAMRNPGYVHELAAMNLDGIPEIEAVAKRNGVTDADLQAAVRNLAPMDPAARQDRIHQLYVSDALEKGYAEGDPNRETTWVLGQRAHAYYDVQAGRGGD